MIADVVVLPGADRVPHGFIDLVMDPRSFPRLLFRGVPFRINGWPFRMPDPGVRLVAPAGPIWISGGLGYMGATSARIAFYLSPGQAVRLYYRPSNADWLKGSLSFTLTESHDSGAKTLVIGVLAFVLATGLLGLVVIGFFSWFASLLR